MSSLIKNLGDIWHDFKNITGTLSFSDILDIAIMTILIYTMVKLIRDTRSGQLIKGLLLLGLFYFLASNFEMLMIKSVLAEVFKWTVVVLCILFQPEIRKALEQVGRSNFGHSIIAAVFGGRKPENVIAQRKAVEEVIEAVAVLQQLRMGALIVFERKTKLNDVVATGTLIEAEPSAMLIGNIFYNKAPLHDGSMIIREGKLLAAGCILPLTHKENISASLGTRHRAAIGLSEDTDAVTVVVSEETGQVSIAENGLLKRNYTRTTLREELLRMVMEDVEKEETRKSLFQRLRRQSQKESEGDA